MLFVGRNDGFDARNNDNFFKILWSNLINFDKEHEIYKISIIGEGEKGDGSKGASIFLGKQGNKVLRINSLLEFLVKTHVSNSLILDWHSALTVK